MYGIMMLKRCMNYLIKEWDVQCAAFVSYLGLPYVLVCIRIVYTIGIWVCVVSNPDPVLVALANGIRQSYVPSQGVRLNQTDCRVLQDQVRLSVVLLFRRFLCCHAKRGTLCALTTYVDVTYCNCQMDFTYEITMCCCHVSKCHCLSH